MIENHDTNPSVLGDLTIDTKPGSVEAQLPDGSGNWGIRQQLVVTRTLPGTEAHVEVGPGNWKVGPRTITEHVETFHSPLPPKK